VVAAAVLGAFLPCLGYGFAPIDDERNILDNPSFRGLGPSQLRWMMTTRHTGHFIPLTWLTLGADYTLWGLRPFGYHLTSVLFHLATAVAFFLLCLRLLDDRARPGPALAGALAASLFFAVHPLRVESVVWISERRDVVCGLFSMLTLHAYVSAARASGRRRRALLALTCALFAAALLAKGIAVGLLVAFFALDVTVLRRLPARPAEWAGPEHRAVIVEKLPLVLLSVAAAASTLLAIRPVLAPLQSMGVTARLAAGVYGLTFYVQKTAVPYPLPLIVYQAAAPRLLDREVLWRGVLLVATVAALVAWRRRAPGVVAAALTYAAFVLPVSGLLQAGPQLVAHRYSYHSCWSWALLLGAGVCGGLARAPRGLGRRAACGVAGLLALCGLLALTRAQMSLWRDTETFSAAAAAASPAAWQPRYSLAGAYLRTGRWAEAARQLRVGLLHDPAAPPLLNMAALLFATCPDAQVRDGVAAAALAERLQAVSSARDPWALLTLSAARAENGDLEGAAAAARAGIRAAADAGDAEPARRAREALARYESGRPLRMEAAEWGTDRLRP